MELSNKIQTVLKNIEPKYSTLLTNPEYLNNAKNLDLIKKIIIERANLNQETTEALNNTAQHIKTQQDKILNIFSNIADLILTHDASRIQLGGRSAKNVNVIDQFNNIREIRNFIERNESENRWDRLTFNIVTGGGISVIFGGIDKVFDILPFLAPTQVVLGCAALAVVGVLINEYVRRPRKVRNILNQISQQFNGENTSSLETCRQTLLKNEIINETLKSLVHERLTYESKIQTEAQNDNLISQQTEGQRLGM